MVVAELVDGCRLKCTLCWNRNRTPSLHPMPLLLVGHILRKYRGKRIEWFNWGEPLLHPDIVTIGDMVKGSNSSISSSFSLPLSDEVLDAIQNFRRIYISSSGLSPEYYNHYHRGGRCRLVMTNIHRLLERRRTRIIWRCASHPDNASHIPKVAAFCRDHDIEFEECVLNCEVEEIIAGFRHPYLRAPHRAPRRCRMLGWDVIGTNGDHLVCCATHNIPVGLSVMDNPTPDTIIAAKSATPVCFECQRRQHWRMF